MQDLLGRDRRADALGVVDQRPAAAGAAQQLLDELLPREVGEDRLRLDVRRQVAGRREGRADRAREQLAAPDEALPVSGHDLGRRPLDERQPRQRAIVALRRPFVVEAVVLVLERVGQLVGDHRLGQRAGGRGRAGDDLQPLRAWVVVAGDALAVERGGDIAQ